MYDSGKERFDPSCSYLFAFALMVGNQRDITSLSEVLLALVIRIVKSGRVFFENTISIELREI